MTVCPCGRVAVLLVRPTHLAGLSDVYGKDVTIVEVKPVHPNETERQ